VAFRGLGGLREACVATFGMSTPMRYALATNLIHEILTKTVGSAVQATLHDQLASLLAPHMDAENAEYTAMVLTMLTYGLTTTAANKLLQWVEAGAGLARPASATHPLFTQGGIQPAMLVNLLTAKKYLGASLSTGGKIATGALTGIASGLGVPLAIKLLGWSPVAKPVQAPRPAQAARDGLCAAAYALVGGQVMYMVEAPLGKLAGFAAGMGIYQALNQGTGALFARDARRAQERQQAADAQAAPTTPAKAGAQPAAAAAGAEPQAAVPATSGTALSPASWLTNPDTHSPDSRASTHAGPDSSPSALGTPEAELEVVIHEPAPEPVAVHLPAAPDPAAQ